MFPLPPLHIIMKIEVVHSKKQNLYSRYTEVLDTPTTPPPRALI